MTSKFAIPRAPLGRMNYVTPGPEHTVFTFRRVVTSADMRVEIEAKRIAGFFFAGFVEGGWDQDNYEHKVAFTRRDTPQVDKVDLLLTVEGFE